MSDAPASDQNLYALVSRLEAEAQAVLQTGNVGAVLRHVRDELKAALDAQHARIAELEAAIRQWASECAECGGTGKVTIRGMCGGVEMDCDDQPCPQCDDIREYLK